jgi:pimeloyl-ACP methyl ester carboxylesterase
MVRIQKPMGAISQMCAGLTHHVSPSGLRTVSKSIPKILILTGDEDHLVSPRNSEYLASKMPEAEYDVWKETGHAITMQREKEFHEIVERVIDEGRRKVEREGHD